MFKGLLDFLKSFFLKKNDDHDNPFPSFSEKDVSEALNVASEAERHGKANVPKTEDVELGGTEELIKSEFTQRFQECHQKSIAKIGALTANMQSTDIDQYLEQLIYKPQKIKADFEKTLSEGKIEVSQLQNRTNVLSENFETFKNTHSLSHFPNYPDNRVLHIGTLFVIVFVESIMNGYFFAKGNEFGLAGGFFQAVIFSVVNVLIAFLVANYPFRWIFHKSFIIRFLGIFSFLLYLAFLSIFIFSITHYRDALAAAPDDAWIIAKSNILSLNISFKDVDSYLFLILSVVFAVFAFIDSFRMDDRYPGYGKLHRRLTQSQNELQDEKDETVDSLERIKSHAERDIETIRENVEERISELNITKQHIRNLTQNYTRYTKSLEQGAIAIIKEYQQNNKIHRTEPAPAYFMNTPVISSKEFQLTEQDIPDFSDMLNKLESFQKELQKQLVNQTTLFTCFLREFTADQDV